MIRLATIGTSQITRTLARDVAGVAGIRVTHVVSRDVARAQDFAAELAELAPAEAAPQSTGDLDALLRSGDIDAVYIASPNSVHAGQVRAAIRAGIHVLVEKPAVTTAAEWRELSAAARTAGVVLIEGIRTAYDPGLQAVRDLLPQLGAVRRVSFGYESVSSRYGKVLAGERINMFDPELAGGVLYDLGVYAAHPLIALFGLPLEVRGSKVQVAVRDDSPGVDGAGVAIASYDGFDADLSYSKISTSTRPSEIRGELGTLQIDHIASPRVLTLQPAGGDEIVHELPIDGPQHALTGEIERFVELVQGGDASAAEPDQLATEQTLRLMDAIRASWGAGAVAL
ncbi:scyllo-inositol 2-dehydrogenase [Schumannella luteola]|uniref:Putative dehydrogenase n=1 Tax=Schumannella luteola TaxID=472059 RepID=A0A852YDL7_9MICO|nr:Gfo/Idh/MocA family oxidoreductase [Schumannella luteola]NYG97747.1 putative dehydrogenase [Schumannella luteola]TPX01389.1 Gfo/Idh/MocA family oxidoreductase [Schumannella luteola]